MNPKVSGVFKLPSSSLSEVEMITLSNDLHFQSRGGEKYGFGESQTVDLVQEESGEVSLPRMYAYERLPSRLLNNVEDCLSDGSPVTFSFDEKLQASRPDLKKRQDGLIDEFLSELEALQTPFKGGIYSASCGTGKTVVATKLMSFFNTTTVVLVHKEFLMNQWRDRIVEFTDVKEEEIGFVKQKKCDFEGKKVVIAMIQSLLDPDKYPKEFYSWAGLILIDECHRLSAPCFQSVVPLFPARYRIGLSATPRRCLHASTKVVLADGSEARIGHLARYHESIDVMSYNIAKKSLEKKRAKIWKIPFQKEEPLYRVKIKLDTGETREVVCTRDHKFWTTDGYRKTRDLSLGASILGVDDCLESLVLCSLCGKPISMKRRLCDECNSKNRLSVLQEASLKKSALNKVRISCAYCGKEFEKRRYRKKRRFCSKQCKADAQKGKRPWNYGQSGVYKSHRKGLRLEEEYGESRALEIRNSISEATRAWIANNRSAFEEIHKRAAQTCVVNKCLKGSRNGMYGKKGKLSPMFGRVSEGCHTRGRGGYRDDLGHYVRSSWEANFARWLIDKGVEYEYEPKSFDLGETTYTPDFFIAKWGAWVEVKGFWTDKARRKINLFRACYPEELLIIVDEPKYLCLERVNGWE